ncbi:hypothetical protein [Pseudomonas xanthosomatis]|uniref:hypothetical protein n=1 Tax=Pseudomonas xanthosomatis TaxID=2842356 RepID=UPI00351279B5
MVMQVYVDDELFEMDERLSTLVASINVGDDLIVAGPSSYKSITVDKFTANVDEEYNVLSYTIAGTPRKSKADDDPQPVPVEANDTVSLLGIQPGRVILKGNAARDHSHFQQRSIITTNDGKSFAVFWRLVYIHAPTGSNLSDVGYKSV